MALETTTRPAPKACNPRAGAFRDRSKAWLGAEARPGHCEGQALQVLVSRPGADEALGRPAIEQELPEGAFATQVKTDVRPIAEELVEGRRATLTGASVPASAR